MTGWKIRKVYIEVWVEKDALSGVIYRITHKYHVRLMVNRGYSSVTAMHDASERLINAMDEGKKCYILYLGDHDPSGMDMIRDIRHRLLAFGVDVTVLPIALTDEQIKKYNPPPNPAKITDPRAKDYIIRYGATSWEVDALTPQVLNQLVTDSILDLVDVNKYNDVLQQETNDKKKLVSFRDAQNKQ